MSNENYPKDDRENRIEEILYQALSIKDENEQKLFIEHECNGNDNSIYKSVISRLGDLQCEQREDDKSNQKQDLLDSAIKINIGDEIGNYIIKGEKRAGGTAKVFVAEHKILKIYAAIKVFEDKNYLIWIKDHKSLNRLSHKNIVKFYDAGHHFIDGRQYYYIVYELIKGKHFDVFCINNEIDLAGILNLFKSLIEVVEYIHNEKIHHLDLKPDNILVTASRPHQIKLIDFGSSRFRREGRRYLTENDFFGTLSKFAAPEQFDLDEDADHQSDIHALGAIFYYILTGKIPFLDSHDVRNMTLSADLPSQSVLNVKESRRFGLPASALSSIYKGELDSILLKCLEKNRSKRYQNINELKINFDKLLKKNTMLKKIKDWIDGEDIEELIKPVTVKPTESEERLNRLLGSIKSQALDKKIIRVGDEMYLPGAYKIYLNSDDYNHLLKSEKSFLEKKLEEIILEKARDLAQDSRLTTDKIEVKIYEDGTLMVNEVYVRNSDDLEDTVDLGTFSFNQLNKTFELAKTVKIDIPPISELEKTYDPTMLDDSQTIDLDDSYFGNQGELSSGTIDADDVIDFEPLYYLEIWQHETIINEIPILKKHITIGRDTKEQAANIRLETNNKQISRLHTAIKYVSKSEIIVESLHKNITKVGKVIISNGKPNFSSQTKLKEGDKIQIFDFQIILRF